MQSLEGKTALVTGGSRGIGRAIAVALGQAGARVACVATTTDGLRETMQELAGKGEAFACDLGDPKSVDQLVKDVAERDLSIDILVNNAGITRDNLLIRLSQDEFEQVVDVNLRGPFLLTKAFARSMMKQRFGRIINISSVVGIIGNAGQANYASAKAGLIGLSKSVARELAGRGVTCNVVAPGMVETDMTKSIPDVNRDQLAGQIPLGRFGSPEDIAGAVVFLSSDAASYITGQTLAIDGGMSM